MKLAIITSLAAVAAMASVGHAETVNSSSMTFSKEEAAVETQGLLPFLGFGGGYTGYNSSVPVEGTPVSVKLLGSYYFASPYVVDLGFGFNNQQFKETGAPQAAKTNGAFEAAARYRFYNNWQGGIVLNQFLGQGYALGASQGDAQFAGLQVLKQFNFSPSWLARAGARVMTETNNTGHVVNMYLVDLQIGWDSKAYRTSVAEEETPAPAPAMAAQEKETPAPVEMKPTPILSNLNYADLTGDQGVYFGMARYDISKQDQTKLAKVAQALKDHPDLFEKVEVEGYADISGTDEVNRKISQERADQVKMTLAKAGLPSDKIVASGYGANHSNKVLSSDRKTEMTFIGVKDQEALKKVLSSIE